ncbi:MAG: hypothetical protein IJ702_09280, partial [Fretibacterium sp.]|nr:hypothetical protein [Fretibacterium sp.]
MKRNFVTVLLALLAVALCASVGWATDLTVTTTGVTDLTTAATAGVTFDTGKTKIIIEKTTTPALENISTAVDNTTAASALTTAIGKAKVTLTAKSTGKVTFTANTDGDLKLTNSFTVAGTTGSETATVTAAGTEFTLTFDSNKEAVC